MASWHAHTKSLRKVQKNTSCEALAAIILIHKMGSVQHLQQVHLVKFREELSKAHLLCKDTICCAACAMNVSYHHFSSAYFRKSAGTNTRNKYHQTRIGTAATPVAMFEPPEIHLAPATNAVPEAKIDQG